MVQSIVNAIAGPPGTQAASAAIRTASVTSGGSAAGQTSFQDVLTSVGQDPVTTAVDAQSKAQALAGGPANPYVAGPAGYARGAALDYVAQMLNVMANGSYLPNASGPGLTVLPGTPRLPASQGTIDDYTRVVTQLTAQWAFTPSELDAAGQRLTANLAAGVSLDPGTSAAMAEERIAQSLNAAQVAATSAARVAAPAAGTVATPATASSRAHRIASLRALIAHDTHRLAIQQAKGDHITAARLKATLATQKRHLAALLG